MTRVSSFGNSQTMITDLLRNQARLLKSQEQVNTGKKTSEYRGLERDASALLGAKATQTRIGQYISSATEVEARLAVNNLHFESMSGAMSDLRQQVMEALGTSDAIGFEDHLNQAFSTLRNALNANVGGVYIFAGTRTDTPPVNANTLADLVAAPAAADVFDNNGLRPTARVDDNISIEHGFLADSFGLQAMEALKALADFHFGGGGPIDGQLTPAQETFLQSQVAVLDQAFNEITSATVENGLEQARVEKVRIRHENADVFIEGFIGEIENVNLAEAISRLNADQTALEASFRVLADLNRVSLLDFI